MDPDSELHKLDAAFRTSKAKASDWVADHNASLPSPNCPGCGTTGHCPGLPCPDCRYTHPVSWARLRATEFGYEAVALNNGRRVLAKFDIEER